MNVTFVFDQMFTSVNLNKTHPIKSEPEINVLMTVDVQANQTIKIIFDFHPFNKNSTFA